MGNLIYWIWLSSQASLRGKTKHELIMAFSSPEDVFNASIEEIFHKVKLADFEKVAFEKRSLEASERILEVCYEEDVSFITFYDNLYPERLKNIYDPPILLYVKGRMPIIDQEAAIALVGTRKPSAYGLKMAKKIGFDVASSGGIVVTGLAAGIDNEVAHGALLADGIVIGVIGCAINDVYPKWNGEMYKDVMRKGAIISEYPPGRETSGRNFPERNRILSGLSLGTCVIEAPKGSGALITANRSLDQGREVFVLPGNVDALGFVGSNQLIREGASLITCGWEVLMNFQERFPQKLHEPRVQRVPMAEENEASEDFDDETKELNEKIGFFGIKPRHKGKKQKSELKFIKASPEKSPVDLEKARKEQELREQMKSLNENQLKLVAVMNENEMHIDDIISKTDVNAAVALSEITVLEIMGFVKQSEGKRFSLNLKIK